MASLMEQLKDILMSELSLYEELIPIANEKTQIIIKNDVTALQEITTKEQDVISKVLAYEKKREDLVKNIAMILNLNPKSLTLSELVSTLKSQPDAQKELAQIHDKLLGTVKSLNNINKHNEELLNQSLEMVEYTMNLIRSSRMNSGNNYTKNAYRSDINTSGSGMFDAKQ